MGTHAFLGIRYAEPPVGEHRPGAGPARPWPGIRDAAEYGPTAPRPRQDFTLIPEPVVPGDDFLNLNLFTPDLGSANLPVLVWIHGGSFFSGCNRSPGYRGESFARGAVLVSVNYRLGAEGSWTSTGKSVRQRCRDRQDGLGGHLSRSRAGRGGPGRQLYYHRLARPVHEYVL
ncbi:MAG TPA: carboxylesterase family protein, partial [Streptosporangiaceae bacterium]|nr:carboxylesterase family protein [Streptosporangiaceae bacterium]